MNKNIEINLDTINIEKNISNYLALEVTEVIFPTLIENEINFDVFLKEFNDNLIYLIYELLRNEYDKFLITDMFTNFSVLMLNNNKNLMKPKNKIIKNIYKESKNVENILDIHFNNTNNNPIEVNYNGVVIQFFPKSKLKSVLINLFA